MTTAARASSREAREPSWRALLEPPHAVPALVVVLGILSPAVSAFVTATIMPSVVADIGGLALYAWVTTAYAVLSLLGSTGVSVVVRSHGLRAALVGAAVVYTGGTALCALAPSMPVLIVGRGTQGLGAGMMIAAVHGLVREVFPEPLWSRMLATVSIAWGIAALGGPALGGLFAAPGLWRGAFWATVPLAAVAGALTWRILRGRTAAAVRRTRVPLGRLALVCAGILAVASVANVGANAARVGLVAGAAGVIGVMLRLDRRATDRLFPARMLSLGSRLGGGFWLVFFVAMSTTPSSVYIPLLVQELHGISPSAAGYFYAGQSLAWTIAALVSARLSAERARTALVAGPLLIAAGFTGLVTTIGAGPVAAIVGSMLLVGAGVGTCWAHAGAIILGSAREGEGALTASLIPTTQTFAVALGAAVCGIVANAAGLATGAARPVVAHAGTALFSVLALAPLCALAMGVRTAALEVAKRRTP
jgi:MFS family permease